MRSKPSFRGFPGSPLVKTLPPHAGDMGSVPDQETMILCAELCSQKKKKTTLQWLCPEGLLLFSSHRWRDEGWENQGICPGSQDKKDRAWLQCPLGALEAQALPSRWGSLAGVCRGDRFPFFSSLSPPGLAWRVYSKHTGGCCS